MNRFFQRRGSREESALELQAYLERETEENIERGMSPEEARRAAHIKLGNVTNILGDISQHDSLGAFETVWHDIRYGARMLLKHRGFALVSLITLALGIGANTAIFTVVDATLIRPLPYPHAERLVWLADYYPVLKAEIVSGVDFLDWRAQAKSFKRSGGVRLLPADPRDGGKR